MKFIGKFSYHAHGVSGDIYSIDGVDNQLHIRRFKYDGTGQNTYFMAGTEASEPNSDGFILEHPFKGKYTAISSFRLLSMYHISLRVLTTSLWDSSSQICVLESRIAQGIQIWVQNNQLPALPSIILLAPAIDSFEPIFGFLVQFCFQKQRSGTWKPKGIFSAPSGCSDI